MPAGRPSDYTPEIASDICELIATTPQGLEAICAEERFPSARTVYRWLEAHEEFRQIYALARERQADILAYECLDIADDSSGDTITKENADGSTYETFNNEFAARSRIRIDARKWMAGKLSPRKYGDKVQLADADGNKLESPVVQYSLPSNGRD